MSKLKFRNITASPDDPVATWGVEGLVAAIDRGDIRDWQRIVVAFREAPYSESALDIRQALTLALDTGAAAAIEAAIENVLLRREAAEKAEVARRLKALVKDSGLSTAEFATRLGTSRSRLSTYLNGRVCPAASVLVRAEAVSGAGRETG